ncbi:hypothetical protein A6V25_13505 [Nostoc sp. ATCC 53789]|nr:hypothetical protein A6V25_13505 [Nostoc sp. ATCC 53789]
MKSLLQLPVSFLAASLKVDFMVSVSMNPVIPILEIQSKRGQIRASYSSRMTGILFSCKPLVAASKYTSIPYPPNSQQ